MYVPPPTYHNIIELRKTVDLLNYLHYILNIEMKIKIRETN